MSAIENIIRYHDDGCDEGVNCIDSKLARAELARLRAAAAERDGMRDSLQAWSQLWAHICKRLGGDADLLPNESNFDGLFDDLRSWLVPNVTSQEKERTITAQAAQLERAYTVIDKLKMALPDSNALNNGLYAWNELTGGDQEMVKNSRKDADVWISANTPTPQEEPHFNSAQKYREALEQIESVWISESVTNEHTASLKMYTIASRVLNNADDEKAYNAPQDERIEEREMSEHDKEQAIEAKLSLWHGAE